ncbi:hypothetical protein P4S93_12565 [Aneurinibacillus thermoaerophilus]|jgi:hypothetical protein|uniref:Fur-regulated basic protein A n=1 Tax=Aneurinibacillus thermoaerophilus TaxID=143495 RepID=A0ABX8YBW5_ANETH|nr:MULTISPECIES: hypothetical protein [Aneurinibacillus]AMA74295.1 hypothetical protein ACH33_16760 [Aneurinibacillus sp. XH2]MED0759048.1 hypothetical protein [Aneurinibacillus thermoaerophilus]MED0761596.1 hypothetical protein [Aneurinibacillus thermoaerophilus]QYY43122.1 hypothetical protein K3F53_02075 [Aneurinibacillus thermoaerophilus]
MNKQQLEQQLWNQLQTNHRLLDRMEILADKLDLYRAFIQANGLTEAFIDFENRCKDLELKH